MQVYDSYKFEFLLYSIHDKGQVYDSYKLRSLICNVLVN